MSYDEIENLLLKYRQGRCTPAEKARIHEWYEKVQSGMPQTELSDAEKMGRFVNPRPRLHKIVSGGIFMHRPAEVAVDDVVTEEELS